MLSARLPGCTFAVAALCVEGPSKEPLGWYGPHKLGMLDSLRYPCWGYNLRSDCHGKAHEACLDSSSRRSRGVSCTCRIEGRFHARVLQAASETVHEVHDFA